LGASVLPILDAVNSVVSDLIVWFLTTVLLGLAALARAWWRLQRQVADLRSELEMSADETRLDGIDSAIDRQDRYFLGDPNDPSDPGLLRQMHNMEQKLDRVLQAVEDDDGGDD
jgi:hypothetical protein